MLSCCCEENQDRFLGHIISLAMPTPSMSLLYSTIVLYDNSKCKSMRIGISNVTSHSYLINGESLCSTTAEKDLGVAIDQILKIHQHAAATKANSILELISKCFKHLDVDSLPIYIRLYLSYFCKGPHYITDQKMLEKVPKRATRLIPSLRELPYAEHLSHLRLPSLYYRRKQGEMILVYQMLHGLLNVDASFFFSPTTYTGHNFKLHKESLNKSARAYTFSNRVINDWNSLPDYTVNADSLTSFKNLLHEHWIDFHCYYNN